MFNARAVSRGTNVTFCLRKIDRQFQHKCQLSFDSFCVQYWKPIWCDRSTTENQKKGNDRVLRSYDWPMIMLEGTSSNCIATNSDVRGVTNKTMISSSPFEMGRMSSCDIHYRPQPPVRKNRIRSLLVKLLLKCPFLYCIYGNGWVNFCCWFVSVLLTSPEKSEVSASISAENRI